MQRLSRGRQYLQAPIQSLQQSQRWDIIVLPKEGYSLCPQEELEGLRLPRILLVPLVAPVWKVRSMLGGNGGTCVFQSASNIPDAPSPPLQPHHPQNPYPIIPRTPANPSPHPKGLTNSCGCQPCTAFLCPSCWAACWEWYQGTAYLSPLPPLPSASRPQ